MSGASSNTPSVDALLAQARALRAAGRNHEAEASLRTLLAFRPDHGEALVGLGVLMRERGDLPAAIETLARAVATLKRDPEAVGGAGFRVRICSKVRRSARRVAEGRAREARFPRGPGCTCRDRARRRRCRASSRSSAARDLTRSRSLQWASACWGRRMRGSAILPEAEAAFRRWLALAPGDPVALTNLGNSVRQQGRLEEADRSTAARLPRQPPYSPARLFLGGLLLETGRAAEALPLLEQAAAETPESAEPCMLLGAAFEALGRDR